jgi:hydrogenase maturation factor
MCVAAPGVVRSIGESSLASIPAVVEFPDRTTEINLIMCPDASVGDRVIVHSGYAIRLASGSGGLIEERPLN